MNILPLRKINVLLRFNFPSTQFEVYFENNRADLVALMLKNLPAMQETKVPLLGQEDPLVKGMATHSSILFFFFLIHFFSLFLFLFFSLQYSCLENSMDRGAWQATVHRVAKSRT